MKVRVEYFDGDREGYRTLTVTNTDMGYLKRRLETILQRNVQVLQWEKVR